jgi:hypothetical protein
MEGLINKHYTLKAIRLILETIPARGHMIPSVSLCKENISPLKVYTLMDFKFILRVLSSGFYIFLFW